MSRFRFPEERSSAITTMQKTMTARRSHYISNQSSSRFNVSKHALLKLKLTLHKVIYIITFSLKPASETRHYYKQMKTILLHVALHWSLSTTRESYTHTHTESRRQKQNNRIQIMLLNDTDLQRKSNPKS